MKVVLPFLMNDENNLDSPKVSGGLERFSQLIYQNLNAEVIPFYYTREDRNKRLVTKKLAPFVLYHNPDVVISNQDSSTITTSLQDFVETPILWISHTAAGGIFKIPQLDNMQTFMNRGGSLAMVSQWQYEGMNELSTRVKGLELKLNVGLINSAFCSGTEEVSELVNYDCITIGRIDKEKDPFMLHRISGSKHTLVLTSAYELIPSQQEYFDKNQHWKTPKETIYNLPYLEVMSHLSKAGAYFSTCPRETWGITALEAFARGVPVILIKNASNKYWHASENIAPNSDFYATISKKNEKEFNAALEKLVKVNRKELSDLTKKKHSRQNWLRTLENLIDKTIENKKKYVKPISWFE